MTTSSAATSKLLVVEGASDEHAVFHLCKRAQPGLEQSFSIRDAKSLQGVLNTVGVLVKQPGLTAVGFIVDADTHAQNHWNAVLQRIITANSGIQPPQVFRSNGTIIAENPNIGSPRIGIWVMPDNATTGELEDFVVQMVPSTDPVWPMARAYINGLPRPWKFASNKITKAEVHAWLSASKHPGLIGLAIRDGDLVVNNPLCQRFLAWLNRLFN
ncbi:MAG: hypothetical protein OXL37_02410 [Chloroflexota bacterium]|nr:hypothetical protein [Chloroflexota bacterium]MDE2962237.1 hypothetical protein [Chloroflexota bacterium]